MARVFECFCRDTDALKAILRDYASSNFKENLKEATRVYHGFIYTYKDLGIATVSLAINVLDEEYGSKAPMSIVVIKPHDSKETTFIRSDYNLEPAFHSIPDSIVPDTLRRERRSSRAILCPFRTIVTWLNVIYDQLKFRDPFAKRVNLFISEAEEAEELAEAMQTRAGAKAAAATAPAASDNTVHVAQMGTDASAAPVAPVKRGRGRPRKTDPVTGAPIARVTQARVTKPAPARATKAAASSSAPKNKTTAAASTSAAAAPKKKNKKRAPRNYTEKERFNVTGPNPLEAQDTSRDNFAAALIPTTYPSNWRALLSHVAQRYPPGNNKKTWLEVGLALPGISALSPPDQFICAAFEAPDVQRYVDFKRKFFACYGLTVRTLGKGVVGAEAWGEFMTRRFGGHHYRAGKCRRIWGMLEAMGWLDEDFFVVA